MIESDVDFSELYSVNLMNTLISTRPWAELPCLYEGLPTLLDAKPFKESLSPDGMAEDLEQAAKDYAHPNMSLTCKPLGNGSNGHIGFIEPGTPFDSQTHVVDLTDSTSQ